MLVSTYAFVRKQFIFIPKTAKIIDATTRSPNQIIPFQEENRRCDVMDSLVGVPSLKAVDERISKSEIRILHVMEKKFDFINKRIEDVMKHL